MLNHVLEPGAGKFAAHSACGITTCNLKLTKRKKKEETKKNKKITRKHDVLVLFFFLFLSTSYHHHYYDHYNFIYHPNYHYL